MLLCSRSNPISLPCPAFTVEALWLWEMTLQVLIVPHTAPRVYGTISRVDCLHFICLYLRTDLERGLVEEAK